MTRNAPGLLEDYVVSVVDSDGDDLLGGAQIQAPSYQSAWEQAMAIAFRSCQWSGAFPMIIKVVRLVLR